MGFQSVAATVVLVLLTSAVAYSAGGTSIVAEKGSEAYVNPNWPEGVAQLVNHPLRTRGWNDWFTEWPNDVNHYAIEVNSTAEVNRLVAQLTNIQGPVRQIKLAPMAEPRGLGWVTALPEGNNIPVVFSIGDQQRVNEWYRRLGGRKFGVIEFEAAPVAVPPTLTIFVQNESIDVNRLEIPADIEVSAGYCPRPFHKWNTLKERADAEARKTSDELAISADDPEARKALEAIYEFLDRRKSDGSAR